MQQHKWELAIQDFNATLISSPGFFLAAIRRGEANEQSGKIRIEPGGLQQSAESAPDDRFARSGENRPRLASRDLSQSRFP